MRFPLPFLQGLLPAILLLLLPATGTVAQEPEPARTRTVADTVLLGIDVLAQRNFDILEGKRVGLLTHPAGVNRRGESTIEVLNRSPRVNLVALFGPEHGIYGDEKANEKIPDRTDPRTGLPVYSLYGDTRKPTPAMLQGLDTLVIDLQDIGTRSYTYISAMKLAVEACFENDVEVVVLDRPNPLGGLKVDGPMMETRWMSYVGAFRIPYVHGLTIGELARMLKGVPGWLDVSEEVRRRGRMTIVPMRGWNRRMVWPETGLRWVATSPAIPSVAAVLGYPMTGLGAQLGGFKHGYGTAYPFRLLTFPGKTAPQIKRAFESFRIPGLAFEIINFRLPNGQVSNGVYVKVTDYRVLRPTELSFYMMKLAAEWSVTNPFAAASDAQATLFNKHVGSTHWWRELVTLGAKVDVAAFSNQCTIAAREFQKFSQRFWIYD